MPLPGPRPNPSYTSFTPQQPHHSSSYPPPDDPPYPPASANPAAYSYDNPSYSSLDRPAFPSEVPSSQLPYPHQSSPESGTRLLEPLDSRNQRHPEGISNAQEIMMDYRRSQAMDEGDVGLLQPGSRDLPGQAQGAYASGNGHDRPAAGYGYDNPYDHEGYTDQPRAPSPSLGPWDSASQRSLPYHSTSNFPLPQPTHVPLSTTPGPGARHINKAPSYGGLSYIDEDGEYYHSDKARPASTTMGARDHDGVEMGLVGNQNQGQNPYGVKFAEYEESPYPYPPSQGSGGMKLRPPNKLYDMLLFPTGLDRLLALVGVKHGQYPVEQAIERKRRGLGGQRWPVAAWGLALAMTGIMVYELVANYQAMGSPIATKPTFNPMIGPSSEVLINLGARFPPCMKLIDDLPPSFQIACLNDTSNPPTTSCSLEEICGHGGFHGENPNQSWRFFVPIFLHVGIIHLLLNMLAQITAGAQVEKEMGTIPFLIVYVAGGIYGFVLGGNFSRTGIPSVGASGALFATNACVLVDLIMHWKYEERPKLKAFFLALEFLIGFGIGYIPNAVDGLAHLGGWAIGILLGIILYPSISETKRHRYIIWGARVAAFVLVILAFVLTIKNFYTDDPNAACEWCRYLSCIPTKSNEYCKGTGITVTQTTNTKRSWDWL
ncbi:hypothetical protein IAU59_000379 [Kwoniella sp. CBS 9459]